MDNGHFSGVSSWTALGIPALALLAAGLFVAAVAYASTPPERARLTGLASAGTVLWLGLTAVAAGSGLLARFELRPPPLVLALVASVVVAVALGASPLGRRLADRVPLAALVLAQSFRLPLELVMHHAAREGVMPVQLSFSGYNFDIVTGSSALLVGVLLLRGKAPLGLVALWNTLGLACLFVIAVIAVLTSPFLRAFGEGSVNSWVAYFPYIWLPAGCVAFALAGHLIVLRRLLSELRRAQPVAARSI